MEKSAEAFRTISEVADLLDTPAHVLRFWESRFPQIRPVKRAGGRRYYRPSDIALLTGIKRLLHDDGLTIRGVQKVLREQGIRYVADLPLNGGRPPRVSRTADDPVDSPDAEADRDTATDTAGLERADQPDATIVPLRASARVPAPKPGDAAPPAGAGPEASSGETTQPASLADPAPVPRVGPAPRPEAGVRPAESPAPLPLWAATDQPGRDVPAPTSPDLPDAEDHVDGDDGIWLAARLRALPAETAARRHAELRALHDRLARLRDRLARAAERPRT